MRYKEEKKNSCSQSGIQAINVLYFCVESKVRKWRHKEQIN